MIYFYKERKCPIFSHWCLKRKITFPKHPINTTEIPEILVYRSTSLLPTTDREEMNYHCFKSRITGFLGFVSVVPVGESGFGIPAYKVRIQGHEAQWKKEQVRKTKKPTVRAKWSWSHPVIPVGSRMSLSSPTPLYSQPHGLEETFQNHKYPFLTDTLLQEDR